MNQQDFEAQLQALTGERCGPFHAWDCVNRPMIRHWAEALGDSNPAYHDAEAAARVGGHDGLVVAPATMLQAWTMAGYGGEYPPGSAGNNAVTDIMELFEQHGYKAVVATNCEQDYHQPVLEGDALHHFLSIESVSGRKTTALGPGYFYTQLLEYRNQRNELIGEMRFRILMYKPGGES